MSTKHEMELAGRTLTIETGRMAQQAHGSNPRHLGEPRHDLRRHETVEPFPISGIDVTFEVCASHVHGPCLLSAPA